MSIEFYRGSPGKFDSRTLSRETLSRWTGRGSEPRGGARPRRSCPVTVTVTVTITITITVCIFISINITIII